MTAAEPLPAVDAQAQLADFRRSDARVALFEPDILPRDLDPIAKLLQSKRSKNTQRAYESDLRDFFGGQPPPRLVQRFLELPTPLIAARLIEYKDELKRRELSEATINRRLASIRALLRMAYRLGLCATTGQDLVDNERSRSYRDTRGVGEDELVDLIHSPALSRVRDVRDRAMLLLMAETALRRGEVCFSLDDYRPKEKQLLVMGKGRGTEKDPALADDLERLIEPLTRGDPESPLRWACKSTRQLAAELQQQGHQVSHMAVARLLHELGYSLQANSKTVEGTSHPDRKEWASHYTSFC